MTKLLLSILTLGMLLPLIGCGGDDKGASAEAENQCAMATNGNCKAAIAAAEVPTANQAQIAKALGVPVPPGAVPVPGAAQVPVAPAPASTVSGTKIAEQARLVQASLSKIEADPNSTYYKVPPVVASRDPASNAAEIRSASVNGSATAESQATGSNDNSVSVSGAAR